MTTPFCVSPYGRSQAVIGHGRRHEWKRDVSRLQHDHTHLIGGFVVQHQREVIERDDRMQVIRKHFEQLGQGPMAGQGLRDAQQRVVA